MLYYLDSIWLLTSVVDMSQLTSKGSEVPYVLLVYEADEFCNLVINDILKDHVSIVQNYYPTYTICFLTNKLMAYINKRWGHLTVNIFNFFISFLYVVKLCSFTHLKMCTSSYVTVFTCIYFDLCICIYFVLWVRTTLFPYICHNMYNLCREERPKTRIWSSTHLHSIWTSYCEWFWYWCSYMLDFSWWFALMNDSLWSGKMCIVTWWENAGQNWSFEVDDIHALVINNTSDGRAFIIMSIMKMITPSFKGHFDYLYSQEIWAYS